SRRIMGRRPFLKDLLSLLGTSLWTAWFAGCSGGSQVTPPPPPPPPASLSAIWANDGGDKVTQDELRATKPGTGTVINRLWDGHQISIFGAQNEVVNFNLVLEAGNGPVHDISVSLDSLTGPGGATITSKPVTGDGVFNWVGRQIELFYIRYLQIKGLSLVSYGTYDERHIPKRFQRPNVNGVAGTGTGWLDRPDHDKYYPDIAVPLELVPSFDITASQNQKNQSLWADIYIPKNAP